MGTSAIAPAPQHMRALEQANRVRLARAELKRQVAEGEATVAEIVLELPLGGGEHDHRGPFDEPASLGPVALPPVPHVDLDAGDEDGRLDDRAPAQGAGRSPQRGPAAAVARNAEPVPASASPSVTRTARRRRSRARAWRSRRRGRRDRECRSSGTSRGRARRCTRPRARAGSRATPPAPRALHPQREVVRGADADHTPGSSAYSMKLR